MSGLREGKRAPEMLSIECMYYMNSQLVLMQNLSPERYLMGATTCTKDKLHHGIVLCCINLVSNIYLACQNLEIQHNNSGEKNH